MHTAAFPAHPKHICCFLLLVISLHRVGAQVWESTPSGFPTTTFRAVHFPTDLDGWAVGDAGTVLRSTNGGAAWTNQTANTGASNNTLYGVYFLSNTTGWAVGGRGTIRKTTNGGTTPWTPQNATTYTDLYDVRFSSATNGVIVGACGLILHTATGGNTWTQVSSGEAYNITKVRLLPTGQGVAATSGALLLYTTDGGMNWDTAAGSNAASNFRGLDLATDGTAYAVSMTGAVLRSTDFGATWTPATALPGGGNWQTLSLIPSGEVWAGGFSNTVFRNNNGATPVWQQANANIAGADVYSVHFRDALRGWAVGSNGKIFRTCLRAAFSFAVNGKTVTFTNTSSGASSYSWTFGDGNNSTAFEPVYTYTAGNTYTVTLKATGPCGMDSTVLVVNTSPTPGFAANPVNGCVGAAIPFTNTSSANATAFTWYFPGGTPAQSNELNPAVTYAAPGTYDVRLVAQNSLGLADSVTKTAYITIDQPPASGFTAAVNFQTVTLMNTSAGATGYTWDFGDGQGSALPNPVHVYAANGTYIVQLTAANTCGSSVFSDTLQIDGRPDPNFTTSVSSGCAPFSVQFTDQTTGAPTSYEWSFPGGTPSGSTASSPSVTYATPGTYSATLIASNAFGKDTITKTNIIQVNAVTAGAGAVSPVCPGATISLQATGGNAYAWAGPAGFSATQQNPQRPNAAANMAGTYTVTVTDSNTGCTATASATVGVSAPVNAAISAPAGLQLNCINNSLSLTASGGGTYSWSGGLGTSAAATVTAPGTYTVLVTSAATGCTETATATVTKDINIPGVSAVGGTLNCNQTSVVLDGNSTTPNVSYQWTGPNGFSSALSDPAVSVAGTYTLLVRAPNGCTASAQAIVIGVPGSPTVSAAGAALTCSSPTAQLSGNSTFPNVTYAWTGPGNFTSNQQNTTASAPGAYTLKVIDPFGCTGTATATVIDNRTPPAVSATGGILKCMPPSLLLGLTTNASNPAYSWTGPGGFISDQPDPAASVTGIYTVTVTDGQTGCSASATATVNAPAAVLAQIGAPNGTVLTCAQNTVTLQASGGDQYNWSPPLGNNAQASVTVAGVYTVTVTNASSNCTATAEVTVTVNQQAPPVSTTGGTIDCTQGTTLTCKTLPGSTFRWAGPSGFESPQQDPLVPYPGVYVVTVTGSNGCTATATATANDNVDIPNISASADTIFCGQPAHLHGNSSTPDVTPLWKAANGGFTAAVFDTVTSVPGLYFFSVTDTTNGCTSERPVWVAVVQGPEPKVVAPSKFCPGAKAPLFINTKFEQYEWSTGDTSKLIYVQTAGNYGVTVTDEHGCKGFTSTQIAVFPAPVAQLTVDNDVVCAGATVTATGVGGAYYQFFFDYVPLGPSSQNNTSTFTVQRSGVVSLTLSDSNGCVDTTVAGEGAGRQSIPVTALVPADVTINRTVCAGDTVWVGNQPFLLPGTYIKTLLGTTGCDSTVTLVLKNADQVVHEVVAEICADTFYFFNGQQLTQAGFYRDTLVSTGGCDSIVLLILQVKPVPLFSLGNDRSRCTNGPGFTLGQAVCPACTYKWNTGASNPQITVTPSVTTDYSLTVTSSNQCSFFDQVRIEVYPSYSEKKDTLICFGDVFEWEGEIYTEPDTIVIERSTTLDCDSITILRIAFAQKKTVSAQPDSYYVPDKLNQAFLHVTANDKPLPPDWELTILQGPSKGSAEVVNRDSIVFTRSASAVGYDSLQYRLCDRSACSDTCSTAWVRLVLQSGLLEQLKKEIPNAVSPDSGPDYEENWFFDPIGALDQLGYPIDPASAQLYIFNRWGEVVFKADPYSSMGEDGWDGKSGNGHSLPMGTYYFRLVFKQEGTETVLDGPVTVIH